MRRKTTCVVPWEMRCPCTRGAHAGILVRLLLVMCMFQCTAAVAGPPYTSPTTHGGRNLLSSSTTTTPPTPTTPAPSSESDGGVFHFWKAAPSVTRFMMIGLAGLVLILSITIAVLAKVHNGVLLKISEASYQPCINDHL